MSNIEADIHTYIDKYRQTDRQIADRDRQTDRQTYTNTDIPIF